ncbi:hypothetical protein [Halobacteriovorax sp. BALOs_7]|uniref:hypothetical protein n=1 Tax=Halobacteriovorax sp. BALOs_7 TaxID=2109558 RepID=UPI000EA1532D|nr:hypothetical protein [Halobacteriovorax sp. BALOs_7]
MFRKEFISIVTGKIIKVDKKMKLVYKSMIVSTIPLLYILLITSQLYYIVHKQTNLDIITNLVSYLDYCMTFIGKLNSRDITKASATYIATLLIIYRIFRSTFEDKWKYAANIFNDLSKFECKNKYDVLRKRSLFLSLAIDVKEMGLEEHRSFKPLYNEALNLSKKHCSHETHEKDVEKIRLLQNYIEDLIYKYENSLI